MTSADAAPRYRAVSMELAAYLDGRYVEMHITTDAGETVSVVCPRDSIFAIQRHIEQIGRDCPEIASWRGDEILMNGGSPPAVTAPRGHDWR
jgi:hypothetical protein